MSTETTIYTHLKSKGVSVYFPGQALNDVLEPRVVVKKNGTSQYNELSTTLTTYDLMCYVPVAKYSELSPFVDQIKEYMRELQPAIMPTYFETPSFLDETVKGQMISIEYRNYKKI